MAENDRSAANEQGDYSLTHEARDSQQTNATYTEWAQIATDKVVVATPDRAWLYKPRSPEERFARPMEDAGSFATTRKLLDTAIAAAKCAVKSEVRPPALTSTRWIWRLAGLYHLCHPIPRLIESARQQFAAAERWSLARWAAQNAEEEEGHDLLALKDIQSLGYDPNAVVKALVPPASKILIDYLTRSVNDSDPIDCVGYAYTMERLALGVDEQYIKDVEALLPQGVKATRCLRVHSSVGADIDHVAETVEMVAELSAIERTRVAIACYETALLCFSPPSDYLSDESIEQILAPLKSTNVLSNS
jgi:hypothetical protein